MPDPHVTKPMLIWADIDIGIADMVAHLNTIPGVRTLYSCQGTIGEGGPYPYKAQVGVTWPDDETLTLLLRLYDVTLKGNYWGDLHPRDIPDSPTGTADDAIHTRTERPIQVGDTVFDEVRAERVRQDRQWGGAAHDDIHDRLEWCRYIDKQILFAIRHDSDPVEFENRMIKAAALAVAAIESSRRLSQLERVDPEKGEPAER